MNFRKQFLVGATALMVASLAQAAQVVVTFTGVITDSWDFNGTIFGAGQGYSTLVGKTVVQEYTFDSTMPPSQLQAQPPTAIYAPPFSPTTLSASWINVKTTVNGVVVFGPVAETPGPNAYTNMDSLTITDGYTPGASTASGTPDYLYMDQGSTNLVHDAGKDVYTSTLSFVSIQKDGNFIDGVGLDQQFTLDIADGYFSGSGRASWGINSVTGSSITTLSDGYLQYLVQTVTYKTVSTVPEPSTPALLIAGLAATAVLRRAVARKGQA